MHCKKGQEYVKRLQKWYNQLAYTTKVIERNQYHDKNI